MQEWRKQSIVKKLLPEGKEMIHRDAVEILMKLAMDEYDKVKADQAREDERERLHGPMWI